MLAQLPVPVLSIAVDAVSSVDSEDALSGLWNVFTKCKESLAEGRRLENISWRLWYRRMSSVERHESRESLSRTPSPVDDGSSDSDEEEDWEEETTIGDEEGAPDGPQPSTSVAARASRQGRPISRSASPVRTSTTSCPPMASSHPGASARHLSDLSTRSHFSPSARSPINVGKFISALLPDKVVLEPRRTALSAESRSATTDPAQAQGSRTFDKLPKEEPRISEPPQSAKSTSTTLQTPDKRLPTVVLTNPTPRPTPITTPVLPSEETMAGPTPQTLGGPVAGPSRPAKRFPFVPLQDVNEDQVSAEMSRPTEPRPDPMAIVKEQPRRSKIFYIASPTAQSHSSNSDSQSLSPPSGGSLPLAPIGVVPSPQPEEPVEEVSPEGFSSPPEPPHRTRSQKKIQPIPTKTAKHIASKHRALGAPHNRQGSSALSGGKFGVEKAKAAAAINARKVEDEQTEPVVEKGKARQLSPPPAITRQLSDPARRGHVTKPVVPTGVGSPAVTRRRPPSQPPPQAPVAPAPLPSASPLVLKAPPPTPASPLTRHPPSMQSPDVLLRAPPPTPVLPMGTRLPGTRPIHRSPPPPSPAAASSTEDDTDDSEWEYESGSESDVEDPVSRAQRLAKEAEMARAMQLQQAAEEAQRQREMFAKRRTRSRVELEELGRVPSGLSKLFHPEPAVVATVDLSRTKSALEPLVQAAMLDRSRMHQSAVDLTMTQAPAAQSQPNQLLRPQQPTRRGLAPFLKMTKSSASIAPVQSESVGATKGESLSSGKPESVSAGRRESLSAGRRESASASQRWIMKGPPEGEVEETEEDEEEDVDMGMSKSVAQRRLEALASRSGSRKQSPASGTPVKRTLSGVGPALTALARNTSGSTTSPVLSIVPPSDNMLHAETQYASPQPIDIQAPHPYNLPRAEQNTPRTHARKMMEAELSESMRRQLLWVRASKKRLLGGEHHLPRTRSEEEVLLQGGPYPQTSNHNLSAAGAAGAPRGSAPTPSLAPPVQVPEVTRRHTGGLRPLTPLGPGPMNQQRAAALQRTRSLAEGLAHNDYHIAGW